MVADTRNQLPGRPESYVDQSVCHVSEAGVSVSRSAPRQVSQLGLRETGTVSQPASEISACQRDVIPADAATAHELYQQYLSEGEARCDKDPMAQAAHQLLPS